MNSYMIHVIQEDEYHQYIFLIIDHLQQPTLAVFKELTLVTENNNLAELA